MSIWIIIWFALLLLFDVFVIFWWFRKNILQDKFNQTRVIIPTLGHTFAVNGNKGKGKTTTCAGVVLVLSEYLYAEMDSRMNDIRLSLPAINFNELEKLFDEKYQLFYDKEFGESITIDYILLSLDTEKLTSFYTDFLSLKNKKDMIIDYFMNYWVKNYQCIRYLGELIVKLGGAPKSEVCAEEEYDVRTAISILDAKGVIDTPNYWLSNYHRMQYLEELLINTSKRL